MFKELLKAIKELWKEWRDSAAQTPRLVVMDVIWYGTLAVVAVIAAYPRLVPPRPVIVQQTVPTPQQLYSTYQLEVLGLAALMDGDVNNVQLTPEQTDTMKGIVEAISGRLRHVLDASNTNEAVSQTELRNISSNLEHYKNCVVQTAREGKFSSLCQTLAQGFKIDPTKSVPPVSN